MQKANDESLLKSCPKQGIMFTGIWWCK